MKVAPVADVKAHLSGYLNAAAEGPVIITRNGRPVVALVSIADEDDLERLVLAYTPRIRRLLEGAERSIRRTSGNAHDELWKELGVTS